MLYDYYVVIFFYVLDKKYANNFIGKILSSAIKHCYGELEKTIKKYLILPLDFPLIHCMTRTTTLLGTKHTLLGTSALDSI